VRSRIALHTDAQRAARDSRQEPKVNEPRPLPGSLRPGAAATVIGWLQQRQEAQRSQLAHVLHRDVAGTLAAVRMDLSRMLGRLGTEHDELREPLTRLDELVEQAIRAARREMQRLHPALIDHFGLAAAVRHQVDEASRGGALRYTLELVDQVEGVPQPLQLAAYRAVECVLESPALREITIRLDARREQYVLKVAAAFAATGDSAGVDPGMELLALRTWAESLGASWSEVGVETGRRQFELRLPRRVTQEAPAAAG
jgi:signal transduction histidine kinase